MHNLYQGINQQCLSFCLLTFTRMTPVLNKAKSVYRYVLKAWHLCTSFSVKYIEQKQRFWELHSINTLRESFSDESQLIGRNWILFYLWPVTTTEMKKLPIHLYWASPCWTVTGVHSVILCTINKIQKWEHWFCSRYFYLQTCSRSLSLAGPPHLWYS